MNVRSTDRDGPATDRPCRSRVGTAGFEPATSASRTLRATKLRYVPRPVSVAPARAGSAVGQRREPRIVASGRHQKRNGAYLLVPSPRRGVQGRRAHPDQPVGEPARHRAVRDQRAHERQAAPVRRGCARRPRGRSRAPRSRAPSRASASPRSPNRSVRARRHPEVVPLDVRVVEPEQLDRQPVELGVAPGVRQVETSRPRSSWAIRSGARPRAARRGACGAAGSTRGSSAARARSSRSSRARTSDAQPAAGRPDGLDGRLDRLGLGEEVARHDRHVGRRQRREEPRLLARRWRTKWRSDRWRTSSRLRAVGWEDGEVVGAEPVPAALDRDPVGDAERADDEDDDQSAGSTGRESTVGAIAEDADPASRRPRR